MANQATNAATPTTTTIAADSVSALIKCQKVRDKAVAEYKRNHVFEHEWRSSEGEEYLCAAAYERVKAAGSHAYIAALEATVRELEAQVRASANPSRRT